MAEGPQAPKPRKAARIGNYRETYWTTSLSILLPVFVAIILAVCFKIYTPKGALLSGDLEESHAQFELKCNDCHSAWHGPTDQLCQRCHQPGLIKDHAPGWNLPMDHNTLKMADCKHCHFEHRGRKADLRSSASGDCVLCHGFIPVGSSGVGAHHPEVRMVEQKLFTQLPQNDFKQFKHATHLDQWFEEPDPNDPGNFRKVPDPKDPTKFLRKLNCQDCHSFHGRIMDPVSINFEKNCNSCHTGTLSINLDRRGTKKATVKHGQVPVLEDNAEFNLTKHDEFVKWNSDEACAKCHVLTEQINPSDPKDEKIVVSGGVKSEGSWRKLQHWGYSEFKHQKHMDQDHPSEKDPNDPTKFRKLTCTDCHSTVNQWETIETPSFEQHCVACHKGNIAIPFPGRRDHLAVEHPDLPAFLQATNKEETDAQLKEARMWVGRSGDTGEPVAKTESETRRCAMCHAVQALEGATSASRVSKTLKVGNKLVPTGSLYADLEPLLAQEGSPSASASPDAASGSPAGSPAAASPSASESPAAASPSPASTDSPAAAASGSPAAGASQSPASASPAASPAAVLPPTEEAPQALVLPLPLPEDKWEDIGKYYKLRVIAPLRENATDANFVHKPHITLLGQGPKVCEECHSINDIGDKAGPGIFDMNLLPPIAKCAECHNNSANGVSNQCGSCHSFHDKTRESPPALIPPDIQSGRSPQNLHATLWSKEGTLVARLGLVGSAVRGH